MVEMTNDPRFELPGGMEISVCDSYIQTLYCDENGEYHSEIFNTEELKMLMQISEANPNKSLCEIFENNE